MTIDKNNLSGEYHADVAALLEEIKRLERKNDNQAESIREYQDLTMGVEVSLGMLKADLRVTTGERDQLKAEIEALRKDAERYRWLNRQRSGAWKEVAEIPMNRTDAFIDAAMAKEAK